MDEALKAQVAKICREILAPLVKTDGGEMYLVDFDGEDVHIHLSGTCAGCPGASLTGDKVILPALRTAVPKVRVVVTTGVASPTAPSAWGRRPRLPGRAYLCFFLVPASSAAARAAFGSVTPWRVIAAIAGSRANGSTGLFAPQGRAGCRACSCLRGRCRRRARPSDPRRAGGSCCPASRTRCARGPVAALGGADARGHAEERVELRDGLLVARAERPVRAERDLVVELPEPVLDEEEVPVLAVLEELQDGLAVVVRVLEVQRRDVVARGRAGVERRVAPLQVRLAVVAVGLELLHGRRRAGAWRAAARTRGRRCRSAGCRRRSPRCGTCPSGGRAPSGSRASSRWARRPRWRRRTASSVARRRRSCCRRTARPRRATRRGGPVSCGARYHTTLALRTLDGGRPSAIVSPMQRAGSRLGRRRHGRAGRLRCRQPRRQRSGTPPAALCRPRGRAVRRRHRACSRWATHGRTSASPQSDTRLRERTQTGDAVVRARV